MPTGRRCSVVAGMKLLDQLLERAVSVIPAQLHDRIVVFRVATPSS